LKTFNIENTLHGTIALQTDGGKDGHREHEIYTCFTAQRSMENYTESQKSSHLLTVCSFVKS